MRHRPSIAGALLASLVAATLAVSTSASADKPNDEPITGAAGAYSLSVPVRDLPAGSNATTTPAPSRINPSRPRPAAPVRPAAPRSSPTP